MTIKEINVKGFIDVLMSIWEQGADFVDLSFDESDVIKISVKKEYFSDEMKLETFVNNVINNENEANFSFDDDEDNEDRSDNTDSDTINFNDIV